jgi:hypothetical protein
MKQRSLIPEEALAAVDDVLTLPPEIVEKPAWKCTPRFGSLHRCLVPACSSFNGENSPGGQSMT